jgi:hypothetical protein
VNARAFGAVESLGLLDGIPSFSLMVGLLLRQIRSEWLIPAKGVDCLAALGLGRAKTRRCEEPME